MHTLKTGNRQKAPGPQLIAPPSHSVQFYEDQAAFLEELAGFAGAAIGMGGSCLLIATSEHLRKVQEQLAQRAIDVRLASAANRLLALDAEQMLSRFMVEGWPIRERFFVAVEPEILRAKSGVLRPDASLAAFGEMAVVLWEGGHREAALELEQLWNELLRRHRFSLLCAYPVSCFADESQDQLFARVCHEHSQILSKETDTSLRSVADRLQMVSTLQQEAAAVRSVMEERERAIAQRKQVEDRLWRSEEFVRRIVESGVDCVKVLDLRGCLEYISPSGQQALEITDLAGFLGRSWTEFWKEEDRPRVEAALAAARAGGVGSFQGDCSTTHGTRKFWDERITPVRGKDGQIERLIAVSRDLTELRQAQQVAIQAEKLAAAGRMAATIAHEINNPLEAVTNFIYLARTTPGLPDEATRHLEVADRELCRVAQIAQKTLGFYRDTSRDKWLGVAELIEDVLLIYERKMRNKQIAAHVKIEPALRVYAKQGELRQVLSNLLANAIDACSRGGSIWLRAHASISWSNGGGRGTRFTLADNGSGMPPDVQRRIFVPFFTTKQNVGTGIGLWVSRSLLEQHGGFLRFRSREDSPSGTVMSFFVPANANLQVHELARSA